MGNERDQELREIVEAWIARQQDLAELTRLRDGPLRQSPVGDDPRYSKLPGNAYPQPPTTPEFGPSWEALPGGAAEAGFTQALEGDWRAAVHSREAKDFAQDRAEFQQAKAKRKAASEIAQKAPAKKQGAKR